MGCGFFCSFLVEHMVISASSFESIGPSLSSALLKYHEREPFRVNTVLGNDFRIAIVEVDLIF